MAVLQVWRGQAAGKLLELHLPHVKHILYGLAEAQEVVVYQTCKKREMGDVKLSIMEIDKTDNRCRE